MRKFGGKRIYTEVFEGIDQVVLWEAFPVENGETVLITFESKNSDWKQGVWLMCDKGVEIFGAFGKSANLWYEKLPKQIKVKCFTEDGILNVYNIWDKGRGKESQAHTSGMLVEDIQNGRRYKCTDYGFQPDFDKLVFTIEHLT